MEIRYSRGASKYDAHPEQRTAEDFTTFAAAVLTDRAERKGLQYVCAPLKPNGEGRPHRSKDCALPCSFLAFDFDGFKTPQAWLETAQALHALQGFAYETASSSAQAPRARAVIAASRPMDRAERLRVSAYLQQWLDRKAGKGRIKFDSSVYRAEQPLFCPPVGARTYTFEGRPVDVDKALTKAPPLEEPPDARERAEAIATEDPVLQRLQERDMVLREMDAGKFAVVCPFESEHTEQTSDTATCCRTLRACVTANLSACTAIAKTGTSATSCRPWNWSRSGCGASSRGRSQKRRRHPRQALNH